MVFTHWFASFANILVLKDSRMMFFEQKRPFELTVCRSGRGQFYILLTVSEIYAVRYRKWLLLTCLLSF